MIEQTVLMWIATVGLLADYVALRTSDVMARATGLGVGLFMFVLFAMHSTGYKITTNAGVVIRNSDMSLAAMGLILAAATFILLLETAFRVLNQ